LRADFSKLYAITDADLSRLSHLEQVERLCSAGARLIQLRDKHSSSIEFYKESKAALRVARAYGATLIINDRVDVALAIGADGVHLGQQDLPAEAARRLLGADKLIGISTHNVEQAQAALLKPVDYIAFGPIFQTKTKQNPDPEVGLESLRKVRQLTQLPLVAIGGITLDSAQAVIAAGADSVGVISDLIGKPEEIGSRTNQFLELLGS
jgi:thiamine-phosphate pyrophosphorylase